MYDSTLTVRQIAAQRLPDACFAFVGACETFLGGTSMPDETITLATALHLAGYRDVIATQWQVSDSIAELVASRFYQLAHLESSHSRAAVPQGIAGALRAAILEARAGGAPPLYWAPFIHTGP